MIVVSAYWYGTSTSKEIRTINFERENECQFLIGMVHLRS